jgi:hypothetical protein
MPRTKIRCYKEHIEWDRAVVVVHPKGNHYGIPTRMLFEFPAPHDGAKKYALQSVISLADQWTYVRGICYLSYHEDTHEFYRARQLAIKTVATYRRNYLKKYGAVPNELGFITGERRLPVWKKELPATRTFSRGNQTSFDFD